MTDHSTLASRRLTVNETTIVAKLALPFTNAVLKVDPPVTCEPGVLYRADLDLYAGTATITEVPQ